MPIPELAAKSESPITTSRVSGFGASCGAFASVEAAAGAATADPMAIGPFLSPFDSSSDTWPVVNSPLMSLSAQLRGLVSTNAWAVRPLTPPDTGAADRAIGKAVRKLNDPFLLIACEG